MESKDIIKVLECCGYDEDMCLDCPIAKECESNELILEKKEEILELIKNQQAEIKRLKDILDKKVIESTYCETDPTDEEIEYTLDDVLQEL